MPWTCPSCQRRFKLENQWHSCIVIDPESHFVNKNKNVKDTYNLLVKLVSEFGKDVRIEAVKNSIMVKGDSTFLAIKPKRDHLIIEFTLDKLIEEFPVFKSFHLSKNRFIHYVALETPEDVDEEIKIWLKSAYKLTV